MSVLNPLQSLLQSLESAAAAHDAGTCGCEPSADPDADRSRGAEIMASIANAIPRDGQMNPDIRSGVLDVIDLAAKDRVVSTLRGLQALLRAKRAAGAPQSVSNTGASAAPAWEEGIKTAEALLTQAALILVMPELGSRQR